MRRQWLCATFVGATFAVAGCQRGPSPETPDAPPTSGTQNFRLFYDSQIGGELEPCGCTLEPLGGLARLATFMESRREAGVRPLLVTHGDLRAQGTASAAGRAQQVVAAKFLQRSLIELGLTVAGDGPADEGLGKELAPLRGMKDFPHISPGQLLKRDGVQWLRGDGSKLPTVTPDEPAILLFEGELEAARTMAPALLKAGVDLVLLPVGADEGALMDLGGLFALRGGQRGQSLIEVNLIWRGDGPLVLYGGAGAREEELQALNSRIDALIAQRDRAVVKQKPAALIEARSAQVERAKAARAKLLATPLTAPPGQGNAISAQRIPLDSKVEENPGMHGQVQAHHRSISELNQSLEAKRECPPEPPAGTARVVGSGTCKTCHAEAYDHWQSTPHAKAWATLEAKGRTYDYGCVGCHSVGFDKPEGFCRVSEAGDRLGVGCEACHGPGSNHAATGDPKAIRRSVDEGVCTGCHHPPHTKTFILSDRLTRILGAGHGG